MSSNTTRRRSNLIPRPIHAHDNLKSAMGLTNNEERYKEFTALERDPSLKQYDGAWPVGIYTAKFLGRVAYTNRHMRGKRGGTESRDVDEANGTTQSASGLSAVTTHLPPVATGDDHVSSRTVLPMAATSRDPPIRSLHHLLRSFDPPLDSLMAELQIGGVTTAVTLLPQLLHLDYDI
ncbi:hypothetical protein PHLCEN_2v1313 [Hermanssonia centrifuga]|uniref:Uncharacterized protein n=1 Tax=Hermanssonia centrifuga TaxID=98765 RepID=A0A2R6S3Q2_9APHY|nr:hypothetical protein PHLCEN_2v1313 [Hermanssonia centrifuga]